jgi:transcriptional regulator with XRE-family HTH domain
VQNNLELEVKKSGMSKTEFSGKVGISLMSFYRYAKGKRIPDIETVQTMSKVLGIEVEDLYPAQTEAR